MQSKQKPDTDREYYNAEIKKKHELAKDSITNSNTIFPLTTESQYKTEKSNEFEYLNDITLLSDTEIIELKELLKVKHELMRVVEEQSSNYNSINNSNSISYEDVKPQTIFVSKKIFKEFKEFTKDHNTTLKQAVTLALLHYMDSIRIK